MKFLKGRFSKHTVQGKMFRLILQMFVPIVAILIILFTLILTRNLMYASVSGNIVKASGFNQNFKDDVDLKMYLYVSGSSEEIPWTDVSDARNLAEELLKNSKNAESRKAMNNVLTLCDNLDNYMHRIEQTRLYDERMKQLETNIYGVTQLIEDYMYSYLYYEAGEMASIQKSLDIMLTVEIAFVILVMVILTPMVLWRAVRLGRDISNPIVAMNNRVKEIGQGDLTAHTPVKTDDATLSLLSIGIEDMAEKLDRQIDLNRQEQIRLRDIELKLIQAQINPHFLYNTLDAIVWLIEIGKNEQAEKMVTSLSSYFRSFLSDGKDIVTIAEEKTHIESYLEIQQVRYRDIMEYEISIDPEIEEAKLPKLTMQPLVENAIYHGLKPKRGKGHITVTGRAEGDFVVLEVQDTGAGMSQEELDQLLKRVSDEDTTSFGLPSVYKRLKLLYTEKCYLDIESTPDAGTTVRIRIPRKVEVANETIL